MTLRVQRQAYLNELASLVELRRGHRDEPVVALLIEAAILHTEANLRVVELAENAPEKLLAPGRAAEQPRPDERSAAAKG
jgi:hypothetical protein